jgi:flagellar biosynthetic protein FliO
MGEAGQVPGIGWESLALSFVSLGAVCVVAWMALKLLAGKGIGKASGAIRIVARCPLEPRRSVYVIEAAGRCFLVGVGEGPMAMLAELDAGALPREAASAPLRFSDVLAKVLRRPARAVVADEAKAP